MKDLVREGINIQSKFKTLIEQGFSKEDVIDIKNRIKPYLIDGKYLYHYTATENERSIKTQGLKPASNANYNGAKGVFLTASQSLYKANLPQRLMDLMDDYYEYEDAYDEKPIVRLKIDISKLDVSKFTWDDDYMQNQYGWNKAESDVDKVIESLDIWGTIVYTDMIPPSAIVSSDFDYGS
jgi:hypothetical protein